MIGLDPAADSLEAARGKERWDTVRWGYGAIMTLPPPDARRSRDDDGELGACLSDGRRVASNAPEGPGGLEAPGGLVFETRSPGVYAWRGWKRDHRYAQSELANGERGQRGAEVTGVQGPLLSDRGTYGF